MNTEPGPEQPSDPSSRRTTILLAVAAVLAVLVVVGIVLVATSGDDQPASTAASSSSVVTQTVTETPSTTDAPATTDETTAETTPETTPDRSDASSATSQDNPGGAVIYDCGGQSQVRPTDVSSIYCGDNSVSVNNITWTRWGPRSASGTGTESINLCRPNCAAGNYQQRQVDVELGKLQRKAFTSITLTGTDGVTSTYRLTGSAQN